MLEEALREIKAELRRHADDIERQNKTPAELRAQVLEIMLLIDGISEEEPERDLLHG